jgi:CheY-like chemotaxis protein
MRILVVDDEPAVRAALERALRLEGYEVEVAADGREALETLDRRSADAVVLDVLMPRVDGLELSRRTRGHGDRTPVLMLTARDAVADRVAGAAAKGAFTELLLGLAQRGCRRPRRCGRFSHRAGRPFRVTRRGPRRQARSDGGTANTSPL